MSGKSIYERIEMRTKPECSMGLTPEWVRLLLKKLRQLEKRLEKMEARRRQ